MANEIVGVKSHLTLETEVTWGTTPATSRVHLPVTDYGVRFRPETRRATPFIGSRQHKHSHNFRGMPSGPLVTSLFGAVDATATVSLAQYLMAWAFATPEGLDLPSKSAEWAEGPDVANKLQAGLRVNSATLSGDDGSGIITASLDLMGKSDAVLATAQTIPDDREKLQEFQFTEATLTLASVATLMQSFQWQVQNNLQVHYLNSFTPSLLIAGDRSETLQLTLVKNSATYDAYRRATTGTEVTAVLVLKGLHNGTGAVGNYTVVTITFNRLKYVDHEDQKGFGQLTFIPLQFDVLKPDSSSDAVTIAYSEAA